MEFSRDPYDPCVAFDDIWGTGDVGPRAPSSEDLAYAAAAIAHRARRRRLHAPPPSIVGVSYDPTYLSFEAGGVAYRVIGDDSPTGLPIFDELHQRFSTALPSPKHVRLDTEASYADFRRRRDPSLASLDERLAALEAAVAAHTADDHGGGKLAALQDAFERHVAAHVCGDDAPASQPIDLPLAACRTGLIECWQEGPEICVSVRIPGPDGQARVATSAMPADTAVEETLGCAIDAGLEPEEMLVVVPPMAQVLGADRMITEICGCALEVLGQSGGQPFVGVLVPSADPSIAAAMALLQRCQRGDRRACAEAHELERRHRALVEDAHDRLIRGQRMKAGGQS